MTDRIGRSSPHHAHHTTKGHKPHAGHNAHGHKPHAGHNAHAGHKTHAGHKAHQPAHGHPTHGNRATHGKHAAHGHHPIHGHKHPAHPAHPSHPNVPVNQNQDTFDPGPSAPTRPSIVPAQLGADESADLNNVNAHRASLGLPPLQADSRLSQLASEWAQHLAEQQALSHRTDLGGDVTRLGVNGWQALGENVGLDTGGTEGGIFNAWLNSQPHRENIENPGYNAIGIGSFRDSGGKLWMVQVFGQF